jgi:hypothetical protein
MNRSIILAGTLAFALLPASASAELRRVQIAVLGMD